MRQEAAELQPGVRLVGREFDRACHRLQRTWRVATAQRDPGHEAMHPRTPGMCIQERLRDAPSVDDRATRKQGFALADARVDFQGVGRIRHPRILGVRTELTKVGDQVRRPARCCLWRGVASERPCRHEAATAASALRDPVRT
ncbi:hypothetical protein GCM10028862_06760 [Luteimonas pelagia]